MKKIILLSLAFAACACFAAQDSALSNRQVRDPVQLRTALNANALDAQTRIAALEVALSTNANVVISDSLTVATNATVGGTLGVTGVATFTAESVHNGGIDADYITVDAAAGIDTKTAGALAIGAATATSVAVGASDAGVSIPGTLGVTGVATFTAAPKVTATNIVGAITLTLTNGPTACDAGKADPAYLTITIGGVNYAVPAWAITP